MWYFWCNSILSPGVPVDLNDPEKPGLALLEMEPCGIFGATQFCPLGVPEGFNVPEMPGLAS